MRTSICTILFLITISYISVSQVVTPIGFEQDEGRRLLITSDSPTLRQYTDSLSAIYNGDLLTGYISTNLHEIRKGLSIEYVINNQYEAIAHTDYLGRFFIPSPVKPEQVEIIVNNVDYYKYDSIFVIAENKSQILPVLLKNKYKILLRGRVYAGNLPIAGVDVQIQHKLNKFSTSTLGCYTDDENYWNCLYLGMFKQALVFENPDDTITITLKKDGYRTESFMSEVSNYDRNIMPFKLRYSSNLFCFPKHNIGLKFGVTFQNAWSVGLSYIYQLRIGNFNRLGFGLDGAMLISTIPTEHSTFENLPLTEAQTNYAFGMISPLINISITEPTNRILNIYGGLALPFMFPQRKIALHPYLAGKLYLDLNKAIFCELKYINYSLNVSEYIFNPYGNADDIKNEAEYKKLLVSMGLLVSF
jgi:hypothetical protein